MFKVLSMTIALMGSANNGGGHSEEPVAPQAPTSPSEPVVSVPTHAAKPPNDEQHAKNQALAVVDAGTSTATPENAEKQWEGVATLPSLAPFALCEELRRAANRDAASKSQLQDERSALAAERARLEKMGADLEKSRKELRAETVRLSELLKTAERKVPKETLAAAEDSESQVTAKDSAAKKVEEAPRSPEQLAVLAKAIRAMKADQAAALVSRMEHSLAVDLLQHMSPKAAGTVMANLKPELAAELMASLAGRVPSTSKEGRP